jgi:DNA-binding transcriptional MerR regulator
MDDQTLTIQEAAAETGLTEHTLRYYERIGLIHQIQRADNGHRQYVPDDVGWIAFLNTLRAIGMSIQQMKQYAELQRQGEHTLPERLEMLKDLRDQVEAHMDLLREHLEHIYYKIEVYGEIVAEQTSTLTK